MIRNIIKTVLFKLGYRVTKISNEKNPWKDIQVLLHKSPNLILFDVGANIGQTTGSFNEFFPKSDIYSFEPVDSSFEELLEKHGNKKNIHLNKLALGSAVNKKEFFENEYSDMSSFLKVDRMGWGNINSSRIIEINTIDNFCYDNKIPYINVLKSDTQGFELEVFKGASHMLKSNKIHIIYFEFIFSDMYKELPTFDEIFKLLTENSFRMVNFYDTFYQDGLMSWSDFIFVNTKFTEINE